MRSWLLSVVMAVLWCVSKGEVGVADSSAPSATGGAAVQHAHHDVSSNGSTTNVSMSRTDSSRTDMSRTDSPILLNHIYDSFSSKHTHHNLRNGPHFESTPNVTNVTVQVGSNASMDCHVSLLQDKSVNWMFRQSSNTTLRLLTLGTTTYSADPRHSVGLIYPNNWRLTVANVRAEDEGTYQCQISTHPPMIIRVHLTVNVPQVVIVDEQGAPIQDKHYESSSTIWLSCIVRHVRMTGSVVSWIHQGKLLNQDSTRGGISVKTELKENGAFSNLSVARVEKNDSGNYTCSISDSEHTTVAVHVLDGESRLAELHHGAGTRHAAHLLIGLAAMFVHRLFPL